MRLTKLGLILIFLFLSAANLFAQNAPKLVIPADQALSFIAQDTQADDLKTQQQLIAELKFLRRENTALKDQLAAQAGTIATQTRLIDIEKERGDFFKDAASKGIQVGNNSVALELKYQEQINMFKDENGRLRSENDKLRSSRNMRSVLSFIGGAGAGYLACRK